MAHVQSMLWAMDYVALQLFFQANGRSDAGQRVVLTTSYASWRRRGLSAILSHVNGSSANVALGPILACHSDKMAAIDSAEIGGSQALLKAGFNIACMMRVYAGIDFRRHPQLCEAVPMHDREPNTDAAWHGVLVERMHTAPARVTLEPTEVVFVKYKDAQRFAHAAKVDALLAWERMYRRDEWAAEHPNFTSPVINCTDADSAQLLG